MPPIRPEQYRRLASDAMASGDRQSARLYARWAEQAEQDPDDHEDEGHEAAKLEAIIALLLSANSEEELEEARRTAAKIQRMTSAEVQALADELAQERRDRVE